MPKDADLTSPLLDDGKPDSYWSQGSIVKREEHTLTEQYKVNQIHNLLAELTTVGAFIESGNLESIIEVYGTKGVALMVKRLIDLTEAGK